jgi:hypothetical protein
VTDAELVAAANFLVSNENKTASIAKLDHLSTSGKSAAKGLYALKRLYTTYTGPIMTIRRSSDDVTVDFYSDNPGNLGTAVGGTGTSLATWLGANTAYVTKWWDQSGVGNHATQTSTVSQPIFDLANFQMDFKTTRYFDLPDGTVPSGNTNYTVTYSHNNAPGLSGDNAGILCSGNYITGQCNCFEYMQTSLIYVNFWWANDYSSTTVASSTKNVVTHTYDNTIGRNGFVNTVDMGNFRNTLNRNSTTIRNAIGRDWRNLEVGGAHKFLNGELYFVCIFGSVLSEDDRKFVERI